MGMEWPRSGLPTSSWVLVYMAVFTIAMLLTGYANSYRELVLLRMISSLGYYTGYSLNVAKDESPKKIAKNQSLNNAGYR